MKLKLISAAAVLISLGSVCLAAEEDLSLRFSANTNGNIDVIGNVTLRPTSPSADTWLSQGFPSNGIDKTFYDVDTNEGTFCSTSADLTLAEDQTVLFAGLYWSGTTEGSIAPPSPEDLNRVKIKGPRRSSYSTISGTVLGTASDDDDAYGAYADVTDYVRQNGAGTYFVADVQTSTGTGSTGPWGAWSMFVVYSDPSEPVRNLTVYDGFDMFSSTTRTISLSGFEAPASGTVKATLGLFVGDGDTLNGSLPATDDLLIDGTKLSDGVNPEGNFLNNSITKFGANVTDRNPNTAHNLSADIDVLHADGYVSPGGISASISIAAVESAWWISSAFAVQINPDTAHTTTRGIVFDDLDGDGVRDAGEPGMAGIQVQVTDANGIVQTVTTDSAGTYFAAIANPGDGSVTVNSATVPTAMILTTSTLPLQQAFAANQLTTISAIGYVDSRRPLYYTYRFQNDSDLGQKAEGLFDSLPAGLTWDTEYTPVTTGGIGLGVISYSNGDRDATILDLEIPPGIATLTLRTKPTSAPVTLSNTSRLTVSQMYEIQADAKLEYYDSDVYQLTDQQQYLRSGGTLTDGTQQDLTGTQPVVQ